MWVPKSINNYAYLISKAVPAFPFASAWSRECMEVRERDHRRTSIYHVVLWVSKNEHCECFSKANALAQARIEELLCNMLPLQCVDEYEKATDKAGNMRTN